MNRGGTIKCSDGRIIIPRDIFLHCENIPKKFSLRKFSSGQRFFLQHDSCSTVDVGVCHFPDA